MHQVSKLQSHHPSDEFILNHQRVTNSHQEPESRKRRMTSPSIASNRTQKTPLAPQTSFPTHSAGPAPFPTSAQGPQPGRSCQQQLTRAGRPGRPTRCVSAAHPEESTYPAAALQPPNRRVAGPRPRPKLAARGHSCPSRWVQGRGPSADGQIQYGGTKQVQRPTGQMRRPHPEVTEAEDRGRGPRDRGSESAPSPFCFQGLPPVAPGAPADVIIGVGRCVI